MLAKIATENGIIAFSADVHADNHAMLHVFQKAAMKLETKLEANICHVRFEFRNF
jgi:RimJ/RimL family protein N-acetyltransferase